MPRTLHPQQEALDILYFLFYASTEDSEFDCMGYVEQETEQFEFMTDLFNEACTKDELFDEGGAQLPWPEIVKKAVEVMSRHEACGRQHGPEPEDCQCASRMLVEDAARQINEHLGHGGAWLQTTGITPQTVMLNTRAATEVAYRLGRDAQMQALKRCLKGDIDEMHATIARVDRRFQADLLVRVATMEDLMGRLP